MTELEKKINKGQASESDIVKSMIDISISASEDHKNLGKGKVTKYRSMLNEVSKITGDKYYKDEYEKQVEKYKR